MPLDPVVQLILQQSPLSLDDMIRMESVAAAREAYRALRVRPDNPEAVAHIEDRMIPGPAGELPVRVYRPESTDPLPALVFFHGGGWVIGDIESHDPICRTLANSANCVVVSVEYRLAPEAKFPAAADDAYAAVAYVSAHASEFGADASRIAVGGDSAGGNLAAVVSLMARDQGGPDLVFQLLIYPVIERDFERPSYKDNAAGYLLSQDVMRWFWLQYIRSDDDARNPYAAPILADTLAGLPPALVITAEFDPLRDEGDAYATAPHRGRRSHDALPLRRDGARVCAASRLRTAGAGRPRRVRERAEGRLLDARSGLTPFILMRLRR